MRVCIIIPAYNEEKNLLKLIPQIQELGYDYLVVNDCSTDATAKLLDEHGFNHIDLINNVGLAGVTQIGFMYAKDHNYDVALVIDGDGQHPPKYIQKLVAKIAEGYDYVVGSRFVDEKKPFSMRMVGSRLICWAIYLKTGHNVSDPTSGMRALSKKLLNEFAQQMNFVAEPDALVHIIRKKYRYCEVQVNMEDRSEGVSYFHNPFKSIKFMINILVSILVVQW
ncbi:MAG: glycosyltransferase family 2 protein [Erysipelotrichaceae bacterium]|nr:glycosyltransferase family 2 protein [Erysipelotrichaceae bacterium]